MKRASIKDVARAANVSITTVSHALSGKGVLKNETRQHVLEVAKQLNYVPDYHASSMKKGKSNAIALFTNSIMGYYQDFAIGVRRESEARDYELDIIMSGNPERVMDMLISNRVDGAVIRHDNLTMEHSILLEQLGVPVVYMDRAAFGKHSASVLLDSYNTGYTIAEYLYGLGHRRMMVITGRNTYNSNERTRGFCDYLATKGISVDKEYFLESDFNTQIAFDEMTAFLEKGMALPDAVFAVNDDSAFGCINALQNKGISVPDDVSVIGCDNVPLCEWFTPSLTTINPSGVLQGVMAAKQLFRIIDGENAENAKIPGKLVERASCKRREN